VKRTGAEHAETTDPTSAPLNVAVFASGGGTNFQALLDHQVNQDSWRVRVLVVNRDAGAIERAKGADLPVRMIGTRDRDAEEVAAETLAVLDEFEIDLILLSGYLRLLPTEVVRRFAGRILNIHPALLPAFGGKGMYGMNVHEAVVASDATETGATVHFVTEAYDEGGVLGQWHVPVLPGDSAQDVAARVLRVEHQLYPRAVDHLCAALRDGRTAERMKDVWLEEPPDLPISSNHEETA
jgi:formyltetrahydrofolate-dependent phosphoribosylglycinamide formyltransferase